MNRKQQIIVRGLGDDNHSTFEGVAAKMKKTSYLRLTDEISKKQSTLFRSPGFTRQNPNDWYQVIYLPTNQNRSLSYNLENTVRNAHESTSE